MKQLFYFFFLFYFGVRFISCDAFKVAVSERPGRRINIEAVKLISKQHLFLSFRLNLGGYRCEVEFQLTFLSSGLYHEKWDVWVADDQNHILTK